MKTKKLVRAMAVAIPTTFCLITVSGCKAQDNSQSPPPAVEQNGTQDTGHRNVDTLK